MHVVFQFLFNSSEGERKALLLFALLFKDCVNMSLPRSPRLIGRYKVAALMLFTFYSELVFLPNV